MCGQGIWIRYQARAVRLKAKSPLATESAYCRNRRAGMSADFLAQANGMAREIGRVARKWRDSNSLRAEVMEAKQSAAADAADLLSAALSADGKQQLADTAAGTTCASGAFTMTLLQITEPVAKDTQSPKLQFALGIDLGTTNSLVAAVDENGKAQDIGGPCR